MTEKAISPLRRRLIEDMTIRRLSPKTQLHYIRHVKRFADFLGRVCRQGYHRGCPSLSVVAGVDRDDGTDRQRQCHCPAVLLQGHAEAPRSCRGARLDPRASPPARCSQPGRGRSAARLGDKHQAQGALEPGLCHRPASLGGRVAQAHRYRSVTGWSSGSNRARARRIGMSFSRPYLLELLREWWRVARKKGWMSPGQPWLFPGYRGQHTSARQLHRIVRLAAGRAGITKRVGVHTLRHSFATHLLGAKDRYPRHPGSARSRDILPADTRSRDGFTTRSIPGAARPCSLPGNMPTAVLSWSLFRSPTARSLAYLRG